MNNGWHSVLDPERPESGEEILTLSYVGCSPVPDDLFADPDDRDYGICTYYYPGDMVLNEVVTVSSGRTLSSTEWAKIEKEGFYVNDSSGPNGAMVWRRLKVVPELRAGIAFWKRLDYPTIG